MSQLYDRADIYDLIEWTTLMRSCKASVSGTVTARLLLSMTMEDWQVSF